MPKIRLYQSAQADFCSGGFMNHKIKVLLCLLIFCAGLSILLYPTISNYLNEQSQVGVIEDYREKAEKMSREQIAAEKQAAIEYNEKLAASLSNGSPNVFVDHSDYWNLLNINGDVMAYISIPSCNINLPVRHDDSEEVLRKSVGHLPGTSLPIGGESTHAVLTAHRGLPSAKLFTNIDSLKEGDLFYIHVLDETLAYKVDQIKVVLPEETSDLQIVKGKDYVTLVTCTPYGINTHRLLVRGERTEYIPETEEQQVIKTEKHQNQTMLLYALGILLALLIIVLLYAITRKRRKKKGV